MRERAVVGMSENTPETNFAEQWRSDKAASFDQESTMASSKVIMGRRHLANRCRAHGKHTTRTVLLPTKPDTKEKDPTRWAYHQGLVPSRTSLDHTLAWHSSKPSITFTFFLSILDCSFCLLFGSSRRFYGTIDIFNINIGTFHKGNNTNRTNTLNRIKLLTKPSEHSLNCGHL